MTILTCTYLIYLTLVHLQCFDQGYTKTAMDGKDALDVSLIAY